MISVDSRGPTLLKFLKVPEIQQIPLNFPEIPEYPEIPEKILNFFSEISGIFQEYAIYFLNLFLFFYLFIVLM